MEIVQTKQNNANCANGVNEILKWNKISAITKLVNDCFPLFLFLRLCALIQDSYGMFGEVLLQCVSTELEIQENSEQLEGRVCLLQALRVVQRLTRDKWVCGIVTWN